jgi:hypothetical protein
MKLKIFFKSFIYSITAILVFNVIWMQLSAFTVYRFNIYQSNEISISHIYWH